MTNKEAIKILKSLPDKIIGIIMPMYEEYDYKLALDLAIKALEERPQGEWIDTGDKQEYWAEEYQCLICGAKDHWHNFCPNCGADMRGNNGKHNDS